MPHSDRIPPLMPVYRRSDLTIVRGEGCLLIGADGRAYLDFASGIAVNSLGHCHPQLVAALKDQAETLWHCSNIYRIPEAERLAGRLVEATFAETVFFCSSGGEAVEAGLKIMRRHHFARGQRQRHRIITFDGGFHGRSFAGISAGGTPAAREGYAPLLPGFDCVAFGNLAAVEAAISPETAGILIEPVQGEGGVRAAAPEFLQGLRVLADRHGLLLMFDEVQCGMGRTGTLFAFEQAGIAPDLCSVAKGIGGGFPLGALLATAHAAEAMSPGTHGSTYGANPLAMRVGNAVLDVMLEPGFLDHVNEIGMELRLALSGVVSRFPRIISELRGAGLMLGLAIEQGAWGNHYTLAARLRENGLLTAPAAGDAVIRLLPPLIIRREHVREASDILEQTLESLEQPDR